jgi:hypothetical protein
MACTLDLSYIEPVCRQDAHEAFISGNGPRFADAGYSLGTMLELVIANLAFCCTLRSHRPKFDALGHLTERTCKAAARKLAHGGHEQPR